MAASRKKKSSTKHQPPQKQDELLARAVEEVDAQLRGLTQTEPLEESTEKDVGAVREPPALKEESTEKDVGAVREPPAMFENTDTIVKMDDTHTDTGTIGEPPVLIKNTDVTVKMDDTHTDTGTIGEPPAMIENTDTTVKMDDTHTDVGADREPPIISDDSSLTPPSPLRQQGEGGGGGEGRTADEDSTAKRDPTFRGGLVLSSRLERVRGWGMSHGADMYETRPTTVEQAQSILYRAYEEGVKVTLRGSGQSYGDASIGQDRVLMDLTRMRRVLAWDPINGVIDVEPGVRIVDLWHYTLEDGWWPPVVSGTMRTSLGGGLGVNIHGKNSFKYGTLGDHVLEIDVLTGDGRLLTCSPQQHREFFYAVIGSGGLLGVITRIRLQMKRVYSGEVLVETFSTRSIQEMIDVMEAHLDQDYLVGWVDGLATNFQLGRGTLHIARNLKEGEDKRPQHTLKLSYQELPEVFLGFVPKSMLWMGLWMFLHRPGMRLVNTAKFYADRREAARPPFRQSHAGFNFLLDYVPGWQKSYQPGGLIQYQTFVPKAAARQVFEQQLLLSQKAGIPPFLAVLKKHLPDDFLMSYNVDGYSFALDYPVRQRNQRRLHRLVREMTEVVIQHGGRFYFAKDGMLTADEFKRSFPADRLRRLRALKAQLDPHSLLISDLSERLALLEE